MNEKEKLKIVNEYRKRFIRWQELTQTQLSNTNNLILTFAVGFIAFAISKTGLKRPDSCAIFLSTISGYLFLLTSIFTGLLLTINRLYDFRKTKNLVKYKRQRFESEKSSEMLNSKISVLISETEKHGKITWCLLHWQLWTFFIGLVILGTTIIIINN